MFKIEKILMLLSSTYFKLSKKIKKNPSFEEKDNGKKEL